MIIGMIAMVSTIKKNQRKTDFHIQQNNSWALRGDGEDNVRRRLCLIHIFGVENAGLSNILKNIKFPKNSRFITGILNFFQIVLQRLTTYTNGSAIQLIESESVFHW